MNKFHIFKHSKYEKFNFTIQFNMKSHKSLVSRLFSSLKNRGKNIGDYINCIIYYRLMRFRKKTVLVRKKSFETNFKIFFFLKISFLKLPNTSIVSFFLYIYSIFCQNLTFLTFFFNLY